MFNLNQMKDIYTLGSRSLFKIISTCSEQDVKKHVFLRSLTVFTFVKRIQTQYNHPLMSPNQFYDFRGGLSEVFFFSLISLRAKQ